MSVACALSLGDLVDELEAGGNPYPVFFAKPDCDTTGLQWPSALETFPLSRFGTTIIANSTNNLCSGNSIEECPLPVIQSMILPSNMDITFNTRSSKSVPGIDKFVYQRGVYTVKSQLANSTNIYKVNGDPGTGERWGNISTNGGQCNYEPSVEVAYRTASGTPWPQGANCDSNYDKAAMLDYTSVSCGAPFWPSFTGVVNPLTTKTVGNTTDWNRCVSDSGCGTSNYCTSSSTVGTYAFRSMYTARDPAGALFCCNGGNVSNPTKWYACECMGRYGDTCSDHGPCDDNGANSCSCPVPNIAILGTTESFAVRFSNGTSWRQEQIRFCTGEKFSMGGIVIQRYSNGTPACDPIIEELCQNTAALTDNPSYVKLCSCQLEKRRIDSQFAGLNLPVQCFSDICNESNPNVYKTTEQAQGCSAKLCLQLVEINGSAIASEGYQQLFCDGQVYSISNTNPSVTPVANISPNFGGDGVHLGIIFYIALGLLLMMVILLVAWAVRKFVLRHRLKEQQKEKIIQALEKTLA